MIRAWLLAGAALLVPGVASAECADLRTVRLPHLTIIEAVQVEPAPPGAAAALPGYCRLRAVTTPVPGSRIGFELWLPLAEAWNGRLRMFGNGGYASSLPLTQLGAAMKAGYAVTATDTGHQGDDPDFAVGRPESIDDWGWRAVHETALATRALTTHFYARSPHHSYFDGCSTGGHQALMEAQRFPRDFDGIVAGAPGSNRTRLNIGFLWQFVASHRPDGSLIFPADKLRLLTRSSLAACGGAAAQAKGYLDNPFACRTDPAALECRTGDGADCLTPEQVAVARKFYAGARNPRTGEQLYPPWLPGSESGWNAYWANPARADEPARASFWRFWASGNAAWDWRSFDFDRDAARLTPLAERIDATNPDLEGFRRAGGKLLQYHGLADPVTSPWDSRNYFDAVAQREGARIADFYRLFFFPGMGHCGGGPGLTPGDTQAAIEAWVERGEPPDALAAKDARGTIAAPIPVYHGAAR